MSVGGVGGVHVLSRPQIQFVSGSLFTGPHADLVVPVDSAGFARMNRVSDGSS